MVQDSTDNTRKNQLHEDERKRLRAETDLRKFMLV